jgi:hypothetical protein
VVSAYGGVKCGGDESLIEAIQKQLLRKGLRMRKAWECSYVEVVHSRLSNAEFEQILDEWSEIVYRYLCQLSESQSEVSETIPAETAERTGTDG